MNIFKRFKAPTPTKYKKIGNITKNISYALGVGLAAVATIQLPTIIMYVIGIILFITSTISAYCFAQVEKPTKKKNVRKNR